MAASDKSDIHFVTAAKVSFPPTSPIQAYVFVIFYLQLSAVFVLDMFLFVEPVLSKEIL